jgi:hypothetical protein
MKEDSLTDALLREFLLGKLTDEDRERIEGESACTRTGSG